MSHCPFHSHRHSYCPVLGLARSRTRVGMRLSSRRVVDVNRCRVVVTVSLSCRRWGALAPDMHIRNQMKKQRYLLWMNRTVRASAWQVLLWQPYDRLRHVSINPILISESCFLFVTLKLGHPFVIIFVISLRSSWSTWLLCFLSPGWCWEYVDVVRPTVNIWALVRDVAACWVYWACIFWTTKTRCSS